MHRFGVYLVAFGTGITGGYFAAAALAGVLHYGLYLPEPVVAVVSALSLPILAMTIALWVGYRLMETAKP